MPMMLFYVPLPVVLAQVAMSMVTPPPPSSSTRTSSQTRSAGSDKAPTPISQTPETAAEPTKASSSRRRRKPLN